MNRDDLLETAYQKTQADFDLLEAMTDEQLRELLGITAKPEPKKPKPRKQSLKPVPEFRKLESVEFVEHDGALHRIEIYSDGGRYRIKCGNRVLWNDKTVSSSIVLHWLRTGEIVKRVPRERKTFKAAIRLGAKVLHLGYFATRAECGAAKENAKFKISVGLDPLG